MANSLDAPFVADISPDFILLRSDIRADLREAESEFRRALIDMFSLFPPEFAATADSMIVETPAGFIKGLLPFFAMMSQLKNDAEGLKALMLRTAGGRRPN